MGLGLDATYPVASGFNVRAGASYFTYNRTDQIDDLEVTVSYDADLELSSFRALLDWHPFVNAFRVSGGLMYNANSVDAFVEPTESYTVRRKTFQPERIGTMTADVSYGSKIAPYLGIGVGDAVASRIGFAFDLGVLYTGSPSVTMEGTGLIAPTASQDRDLEEGLSVIYLYPVLSFGLSVGI